MRRNQTISGWSLRVSRIELGITENTTYDYYKDDELALRFYWVYKDEQFNEYRFYGTDDAIVQAHLTFR